MSNSWLQKLKNSLSKTSSRLSQNIISIFSGNKIDETTIEQLEEALISADLGVYSTERIISELKKARLTAPIDIKLLKQKMSEIITESLCIADKEFELNINSLNIIMVCGVNGNGKTTSIGKLAANLKQEGKSVILAAADTFRAAAIEQLEEWGDRVGCPVIKGEAGGDPASVVYKALEAAKNYDVLIIDTAGRLYNQKNLMDELAKIVRVIKKFDDTAPHHTLLVLDGTTGQNAYTQLESFKNCVNISGLIVTKLDGTSRAGVVVGLVDRFKLPIYFIGIGEQIRDLKKFSAKEFAESIFSIESAV